MCIETFLSFLSSVQLLNNSFSCWYMNVIKSQYLNYIGHVCRCPGTTLAKKTLFAKSKRQYQRDPWINIAKLINVSIEQAKR